MPSEFYMNEMCVSLLAFIRDYFWFRNALKEEKWDFMEIVFIKILRKKLFYGDYNSITFWLSQLDCVVEIRGWEYEQVP